MDTKRILSLDYGFSRIGAAISDRYNNLTIALPTVKNKGIKSVSEEIEKLVKEYNISVLLIGDPADKNGNKGEMSAKIREEVKKIEKELSSHKIILEIIFWDEMMTSFKARETLVLRGKNEEEIKRLIDSESASIILQEYLDNRKK